MTPANHPRRPPRLTEIFSNYESPLFFVTFNTMNRRPLLATSKVHMAFQEYARRGLELRAAVVGRDVIMPDHVHLFTHPIAIRIGQWIKGLKRAMSKMIESGHQSESHWQPGFFDHLLRNDESYEQKWNYVRMNPVRAGLVANADDWPFQGEIVQIEQL